MTALHRTLRRAGMAVAATAALGLAGASMASAHHCYKDYWTPQAYENVSSGTPWMALSDVAKLYLLDGYADQCGYVADEAVAQFMAQKELTEEPLIQMRATVGGGALYHTGKEPKPFSYLTEEDFGALTMAVVDGMATCAPGWELPA